MKRYYELKQGHGWFGGYVKQTDVISCVDSGMWKWHILIAEELVESNEIIERERDSYKEQDKERLSHGE